MQNRLYSDEYYLEKAMQALEPLIANDFYASCLHPGCTYKSRKSLERHKVEGLGAKHSVTKAHRVAVLNHRIAVDIIGLQQTLDDDEPPF